MLDAAKLAIAIKSTIFLSFFVLLFIYFYYRYFWDNPGARDLFKIFIPSFGFIVLVKFLIGLFYKDYIQELFFFYAIPSPKAMSLIWPLIALLTFFGFLYYRRKIEALSKNKFLLILFLIFFALALGVAGIREGAKSIADPFTRTFWEYSGNMGLVRTVKDFLHNYISLIPRLAEHSTTHPPGYTLVLYFVYKYFKAGFFGMSLWVVFIAGLTLWPLYFLWRYFLEEIEVKRALEIFIFVPSVVMMTATSMEGVFMFLVWCAIALVFIGWQKNIWLAGLGGLAAAMALLTNFLFLLLAPFFLFLAWHVTQKAVAVGRSKALLRVFISLALFFLFFFSLWQWSGYSIVDNFFAALAANQGAVRSNFESIPVYFLYIFMNIVNFLIYLGLPLFFVFLKGLPATFKNGNLLFKSGLWILLFFLAVGVFQANVERLWLFIVPFFMVFKNKLFNEECRPLFHPFLSLMLFQIVVTQILFYTFF
ncbi:hypothetical protein A3B05_01090 [Candidatus Giovannonibacteria bacterium RIFCSPLOWO2_01_FULL_43_160]|uniref:Glycosyltransferase RgtA/B/C/D-like domain-containing protein n=3 Tax=Parcubacteria group TaxID=1794811 RepID=A0A0G1IXM0_9BACT|nr:MAG: hypothetical protein UV72_C0001G0149 [Candidatus Giovannonibacteria bacterium GW2011_GWB1_43_13]KKS99648.1 MAG: hypothetical protein UV75_C0002G0029 [Candidatus Giovannonibacteria bacterium GW2011_GWA1_43_15]KKT21490.1 MAG: hypothetical protein UW05_C0009G0024 [Candidatus Giovannonibacteria bacterium GW2011_GWC2_43_8]KKT63733.1 MAG: hypothetical protein UW55_C0001G0026 [Candidatus Giovannonibacteria bacterium GW2011_GWA2_44_26]OGF58296.1 MAG: hypothetical protein A2652_00395 [Candidatus